MKLIIVTEQTQRDGRASHIIHLEKYNTNNLLFTENCASFISHHVWKLNKGHPAEHYVSIFISRMHFLD